MSIIKSLSVGNGDMFYIRHDTDNFSIIDCCIRDEDRERMWKEISRVSKDKGIIRFISTHPDMDHIRGLTYLNNKRRITNFYCVQNNATDSGDEEDFRKYMELRDSGKAFFIYKGCSRKWMNKNDTVRKSAGINVLWPNRENREFKLVLRNIADEGNLNNMSPILTYTLNGGAKVLWMGDLEDSFIEKIADDVKFSKVNILFAPHHGRDSGKVPSQILKKLDPDIVVIGEAPHKHLNYYEGYDTITQNTALDITFECVRGWVHVYSSSDTYKASFLQNKRMKSFPNYLGSLCV